MSTKYKFAKYTGLATAAFLASFGLALVPFHKDYDGLTDPLGGAGWG